MSRAKRLEEILEECVTAHSEGRRSLEQSLSLYPALRSELEPLLRTAIGLRSTFHTTSPSPAAQQRGLARFLSDARARRNLKTLRRQSPPGWLARFFAPQYRMGLGAVAAGLAITAVAIGMAGGLGDGGNGNDPGAVENVTPPTSTAAPRTPTAVQNLRDQIDVIRARRALGHEIGAADLEALTQAARNLQSEISPEDGEGVLAQVGPVIKEADDLLGEIALSQPATPEVETAQDTVRDVAGGFGIDLNATDTPTPVETPVTEPTTPPASEPTPVPSNPPTDAPTSPPTAVPTPTSDVREPPGFSP